MANTTKPATTLHSTITAAIALCAVCLTAVGCGPLPPGCERGDEPACAVDDGPRFGSYSAAMNYAEHFNTRHGQGSRPGTCDSQPTRAYAEYLALTSARQSARQACKDALGHRARLREQVVKRPRKKQHWTQGGKCYVVGTFNFKCARSDESFSASDGATLGLEALMSIPSFFL